MQHDISEDEEEDDGPVFFALSFELSPEDMREGGGGALLHLARAAEALSPEEEASGGERQAKLWLSPPGSLRALHFDVSRNFNLQLAGTTRFRLFPPSANMKLHPFPWLHPLSREVYF